MTAMIIGKVEWIFVQHCEACGIGFDEYISANGTHCKQVWNDGFIEIFEVG